MNPSQLNEQQKQALCDLLILGMYSDRHLAAAENARIQRLLDTLEFASDYDRQQYLDASFTRVARQAASPESARAYAGQLAVCFSGELRRPAYEALQTLLASDGQVTPEEDRFLSSVKELLAL
jgi:uncharacterized tellurite resistance protein B-like protein